MKERLTSLLSLYTKREWQMAAALFISYVAVYWLASLFLPLSARFNPASAIALSTLYFGGVRLWPVVYMSALAAGLANGSPGTALLFLPAVEVLQATAGSYLLHRAHIDPLFRHYRDTFYFLATILAISLISPTLGLGVQWLQAQENFADAWRYAYMAALFCFLILTPFLLRWFTKPRFSRTPREVAQTAAVFVLLIGINYLMFVQDIGQVFGIPLVYALLVPLFILALKFRPRFVTLGLVTTSLFAIGSVIARTEPGSLTAALFNMELFLCIIAIIFYIVTSLEEDRRVNTNIMLSQMAALRNAVERESSASQAKNDFIAILSHELRNPLAPVISSIDLLKLKGGRDEEDMRIFTMMEDRMETVRRLLDDLLDISRISEGKVTLTKEETDMEQVLRRAVLTTDHHRSELHQRLVQKFPAEPVRVVGDPVRLEQIFSNLLTNASKYSPSGATITLTLRDEGGIAEITIADKGIGLDPEELQTIFLPFHQTKAGEKFKKGLGIGLTLVRNFVELHGGSVEATSEGPGLGSKFHVRLPSIPKTDAPKKSLRVRDITRSAEAQRGIRVLIIDDNDAASAAVGRLLEIQGCQVSYAYDGEQGLAKARSVQPDLIFLDIGLPDQDGYKVAKQLRERGFTGRLVALTGYGMESAKRQAKEAEFDNYLVKPVSLADLQKSLAGLK